MRGIVLTGLENYIHDCYSMAVWEDILSRSGQEDVIITTADFYPDEQAVGLVVAAAEATDTELPAFIEAFGRHLFGTLKQYYDFSIEQMDSLDELLHSLDAVIHPQVKKLHPDAMVPSFRVENTDYGWLVFYQSERKLCPLAIGLIYGAADNFNESINIEMVKSMMSGHDETEFHVKRI